jgi:hypothetical protein
VRVLEVTTDPAARAALQHEIETAMGAVESSKMLLADHEAKQAIVDGTKK